MKLVGLFYFKQMNVLVLVSMFGLCLKGHYAMSQKVKGLSPDEVGFFN
jgi:hypothetical protein